MNSKPPQDRMMKSPEVVTRPAPGAVSTKVQAHRAIATLREVLGRDPQSRVMTGGTRLIVLPDK